MTKKWIKMPGLGDFRGQGKWHNLDDLTGCDEHYWSYCEVTGFLPTFVGDAPPEEKK